MGGLTPMTISQEATIQPLAANTRPRGSGVETDLELVEDGSTTPA